jgi:hypothetical protein
MERTRVFVSYSHADREWLRRFSLHIAVLERQGVVDLWSDKRIDAGTPWEEEIERALTAAKVAVLLVSPDFLASEFIWKIEMPRIVAHSAQGMRALPLIARPCAWKLERDLARLQARPLDALPLSLGSDSKIDLDLSEFVYEIAALIGRSPAALEPSSEVREDVRDLDGEWSGSYNSVRQIRLLIRAVHGTRFDGRMEYLESGTVTIVEGSIHERWSPNDRLWSQIGGDRGNEQGIALIFRETGYEAKGASSISFDGEYRTIVRGDKMAGAWFSGNRLVGPLTLDRTKQTFTENWPTRGLKRMPGGTA